MAQWIERVTDDRNVSGSIPAGATSKLWQFRLPLSPCLSEDHKSCFLLSDVYARGRNYPTQGKMCRPNWSWTPHSVGQL